MNYKLAIASVHFLLAWFMVVQIYTPATTLMGENKYLLTSIFFVVSVSVFYLSYRKADSKYYSFKTVLLVTAGYWFISTVLILAKLPFLNVVLILGFYYFLIKKNPEPAEKEAEALDTLNEDNK